MVVGEEVSVGTSTGTTAITIDHHHPLFLQPSGTPGSSLISIQLTGAENYVVWSRYMKIGLIDKSKLGFVDRRCTKDKFDQSLYELWEKCNAIVLSWIMNVVSKELLIGKSEKSGKIYTCIRYGGQYSIVPNKGGMTRGNTYKPKRNNLFCDYCNYKGHTRETCYKIHGYPNDFKMRRKTNNFPQRSMVNTTTDKGQQYMGKATANAVSQEGQQILNSPVGNPTPALPQLIMFTKEQYDQILKLLNKDTSDNSKHFAGTTKVTTLADKTKSENWIVDSGATNHMVHTRELLDKINTNSLKSGSKVHLPNGTSLDITCTGEIRIGECGIIRNYQQDKAKATTVQTHDHSKVEKDLGVWHGTLGHAPDKVFFALIKTQFGGTIRILRSDNGTEFFNSECSCLFKLYGMIHQSSCVHTPQQNGVVERKHKHILEVARAIRLQGHLPLKFWGECVHAAVYIINRLPLSVLSRKSSFEIIEVKFMENIFPFQLLKEGKLQVFPNGVIESITSNDTTSPSLSSTDADPPHDASSPSSTDALQHEPVPAAESSSLLPSPVLEDIQ
ncbi:uncharacterized protein LOC142162009 [Nicotiana tabacum]|uniref:Uncharacterized protein LOC142162009 n=1 Tax=Nicotiana tabacum TaxID=4097 RepID=A0AC58RNV4_TOBAC